MRLYLSLSFSIFLVLLMIMPQHFHEWRVSNNYIATYFWGFICVFAVLFLPAIIYVAGKMYSDEAGKVSSDEW